MGYLEARKKAKNSQKQFEARRLYIVAPAAVSKDKEYCTKLHELFVAGVIKKASENCKALEDELQIKPYLDQIDEMEKVADDSPSNTPWRPSRNPLDDEAAHCQSIMLNQQE